MNDQSRRYVLFDDKGEAVANFMLAAGRDRPDVVTLEGRTYYYCYVHDAYRLAHLLELHLIKRRDDQC